MLKSSHAVTVEGSRKTLIPFLMVCRNSAAAASSLVDFLFKYTS